MPHTYKPTHEPPRPFERLLKGSGEITVAVAAAGFGCAVVLDAIIPGYNMPGAFIVMPLILQIVAGTALVAGGIGTLFSLLWRPEQYELSWLGEIAGWSMSAGASAAIALATLILYPTSSPTLFLTFTVLIVAVLRIVGLVLTVQRAQRIDLAVKAEREDA